MSARWTWKLDQQIPSRTSAAEAIVDALLAQLEQEQWDSHDLFGVHLAVEEALVNAIIHGNKEDPSKSVHVRLKANHQRLRVEITDQGSGFNPSQVPDPTQGELLEMPHGRGIMLIRSYMTRVEFKGRGNQLVMEKLRSASLQN